MSFKFNFSWDINKALTNKKKHKVTFEEATVVFQDQNALSLYDEEHSHNEDRWLTLGKCPNLKILLVVHTYVEYNENMAEVRIISARKASSKEAKAYKGG